MTQSTSSPIREALDLIRNAHECINKITVQRAKLGPIATQAQTAGHGLALAESILSAALTTPEQGTSSGELELAEKLIAAKRAGEREQSQYRLDEMRRMIDQGGDSWGIADWDDVRDYVFNAAKARAALSGSKS